MTVDPLTRTVVIETTDGLTLVGDEWGEPSWAPVLMLHGAGQNRHAWKGTAAALANRGWFVLTVDARGHGDSDWSPDARYDSTDSGGDVLTIRSRFDRPPVVIGASMGGMASLSAQVLHGEGPSPLYRAVVLVDIAPNFAFEGAKRIVEWMTRHPDGFVSLEDASDAMAEYNPNRPRPRDLTGLTKVLRRGTDGRWHWRWDPAYMSSRPGFADGDAETMRVQMAAASERMLAGARLVGVPMLLVRGGRSDLVTPEAAQAFLDAVPGTEFADVAGTGHMVAGDDNDAFTSAVIGFLDRTVSVDGSMT